MASKWLCIISILAVASCDRTDKSQGRPQTIRDFAKPDLIGERVAYLETLTGPAMRVDGALREYKIQQCILRVHEDGGSIDWFEAPVDAGCQPEVNAFFPGRHAPQFSRWTVAVGEKIAGEASFAFDCRSACDTSPPTAATAIFTYRGPETTDQLGLELATTEKAFASAFDAFRQRVGKEIEEHTEKTGAFSCLPITSEGQSRFAPFRTKAIIFGSDIPKLSGACIRGMMVGVPAPTANVTSESEVPSSVSPTKSYTKSAFRAAIADRTSVQLISLLGEPTAVHDGIEPLTQIYSYSLVQGQADFAVYDETTGQSADFITITIGAEGRVSGVSF